VADKNRVGQMIPPFIKSAGCHILSRSLRKGGQVWTTQLPEWRIFSRDSCRTLRPISSKEYRAASQNCGLIKRAGRPTTALITCF
jgi:hypothetical protein